MQNVTNYELYEVTGGDPRPYSMADAEKGRKLAEKYVREEREGRLTRIFNTICDMYDGYQRSQGIGNMGRDLVNGNSRP